MTTNNLAFRTTTIKATSRASVKIRDSYYTFESTEERSVDYSQLPSDPDEAEIAVSSEWDSLWETVNNETDNQIADVIELLKNK